jgi:hypothetical protein
MEIVKGQLYKSKTTRLVVMAERKQNEKCFSGQVIIGDDVDEVGAINKIWDITKFEPYSAEIILKEVIDFSKVQFVEMNSGDIVLTNGKYSDFIFEAMKISDPIITTWRKDSVKRVVTPNFK